MIRTLDKAASGIISCRWIGGAVYEKNMGQFERSRMAVVALRHERTTNQPYSRGAIHRRCGRGNPENHQRAGQKSKNRSIIDIAYIALGRLFSCKE